MKIEIFFNGNELTEFFGINLDFNLPNANIKPKVLNKWFQ